MLSLIERVLALRPSFICERRYRRSLAVYPPTMDEQSLNAGVLDLATHKTCGAPCYRGARWALTPPFHPYRCIAVAVIFCHATQPLTDCRPL